MPRVASVPEADVGTAAVLAGMCTASRHIFAMVVVLARMAAATVNYVDVRVRVVNAYAQHLDEMADATSALLILSRDTMRLLDQISVHCQQPP